METLNFQDVELNTTAESNLIHAVFVLAVKEYLAPRPTVEVILFFSSHSEWAGHRAYLLGLIGADDAVFMQNLNNKKAKLK